MLIALSGGATFYFQSQTDKCAVQQTRQQHALLLHWAEAVMKCLIRSPLWSFCLSLCQGLIRCFRSSICDAQKERRARATLLVADIDAAARKRFLIGENLFDVRCWGRAVNQNVQFFGTSQIWRILPQADIFCLSYRTQNLLGKWKANINFWTGKRKM